MNKRFSSGRSWLRGRVRRSEWRVYSVALPVLLFLGSGCERADAEAASETPPRPVVVERVQSAEHAGQRIIPGTVRARDRALLSFEVPGRVATMRYEVGESFKKGAVLAHLDDQVRRLESQRSQAQVGEADAALDQAQLDFTRERTLLQANATTRAAYDNANARLATAKSRLEMAQASAALAAEELRDTVLYAPYAGVVAERLVEPSQNVVAGTPVLRVQGREELEVVIDVPQTLVAALKLGSEHSVRIPNLEQASLQAKITEIGADAAQGGTYAVYLALVEPPPELRSGASVEVELSSESEFTGAPAIPLTAFLPAGKNRGTVFVLTPDPASAADAASPRYLTQRREVEIARLGREHVVMASGLKIGELVVTRGLGLLREGQRVVPLSSTANRFGH